MALMSKEGEIITRAVWTKGVDVTLLPPTQAIQFVELDDNLQPQRMWEAPWSTVLESGLVTPTDSPLPRWRAEAFPSEAWLQQHGTPWRADSQA
jgi:hypothetical protein